MTPFVFYIEAKDWELYQVNINWHLTVINIQNNVVLGKDNTLIIKDLETSGPNQICGDSYGQNGKN